MQTTPVWAAFFAVAILGEKWHRTEQLATLLTLFGVLLIFKPPFIFGEHAGGDTAGGENDVLGIIMGLCGSFSAGGAYVLIRMMGTKVKVPWPKMMLAQAIGQIVLALPTLFATGDQLLCPTWAQVTRTATASYATAAAAASARACVPACDPAFVPACDL